MSVDTLDFDPDALRAKYRQERDRRLRPDANGQYVETTGDFRHYVDDPYVEPGFTRAALTDTVDVVVIGGGFGGLMAAACSMGCMAQVRGSSTISSAPGAPTGRWRDCGLTSALARRAELSRPPRVIFAGVKRRAGRPPPQER